LYNKGNIMDEIYYIYIGNEKEVNLNNVFPCTINNKNDRKIQVLTSDVQLWVYPWVIFDTKEECLINQYKKYRKIKDRRVKSLRDKLEIAENDIKSTNEKINIEKLLDAYPHAFI